MRMNAEQSREIRMIAPLGAIKVHSPAECAAMTRNESHPEVHRRFIDYYVSEVVD